MTSSQVSKQEVSFCFCACISDGAGFVSIRKKGKLPYDTYQTTYDLEYGADTLTIHQDAFLKGGRVLLCDDLLATGGTLAASIELVENLDGDIVGIALLIELPETQRSRKSYRNYQSFQSLNFSCLYLLSIYHVGDAIPKTHIYEGMFL